jgi:nuclear transport factor 2 (NTF2) superfamily protein
MGTRADFYVARPEGLEWLGSIAWDGQEIDHVSLASTEEGFRQSVAEFFAGRDDVTLPSRGWPWPWDDSRLTDYAYVFVEGVGVVYRAGDRYERGGLDDGKCRRYVSKSLEDNPPKDWVFDEEYGYEKLAAVDVTYVYPNMKERQNVRLDEGSGIIVVRSGRG